MSALPQRTQILVKDLLFQEKYNLSHTQTDLMAYLVNVTYWATYVEGYYVIATKKVMSDLPCLGEKTFEASLKVLKEFGLIESKIVEVTSWRGKPKLRAIRLTYKGKEYNSKLVLPSQDEKVKRLEKELKEALEKLSLSEEKVQSEKPDTIEKERRVTLPKKEKLDSFIQESTEHFGLTSRPICNFVPSYNKETTFYINSYNKLSIITQNNELKQLKNPKSVNEFWQWLYLNPQRIGDKIDFLQTPTLKELKQRYIDRPIEINGITLTIVDFVEAHGGVKLKVKEKNGIERFIVNSETQKDMILGLERCHQILGKIMKKSLVLIERTLV